MLLKFHDIILIGNFVYKIINFTQNKIGGVYYGNNVITKRKNVTRGSKEP